jgi:hypothetical protein
MAKFLNISPIISISYVRCHTYLVQEIKVRQLPELYMAGEEEEGGGAGCNGLMYDWLTALFIEAAKAPTEVKEIL